MQITKIDSKCNSNFGNAFYNVTRELDSSVMLSRATIDLCGCDIPWVIMANNNTERKEKARKLFSGFAIAWLTPFITLPLSNRFAMKYIGKLTKSFWSNNHKAIHISNDFLKDTKSMMSELQKMSNKTDKNPLEAIYIKLNHKKQYEQKINLQELLESVGGNEEKLRQKLIRSKNAVFFSDCIFTFTTIGAFPFINNEITKKNSGQSGFSAEMNMADKEIVEKRAENYEKSKRKKFLSYMGILTGTTLAMSLCAFATLYSKNNSKFIKNLRNGSKLFDYNKGIYMSRLPLLIGSVVTCIGSILAARNSTERKDVAARFGIPLTIFYGGDLLLASLFTNLSDRIFGTELRKDLKGNNSVMQKIFPKVKSFRQVIEEVEQGKISKINKKVSAGIFWTNMLILMVSMGYAVPTAINKMIKKDVEKDLETQKTALKSINPNYTRPIHMNDFTN